MRIQKQIRNPIQGARAADHHRLSQHGVESVAFQKVRVAWLVRWQPVGPSGWQSVRRLSQIATAPPSLPLLACHGALGRPYLNLLTRSTCVYLPTLPRLPRVPLRLPIPLLNFADLLLAICLSRTKRPTHQTAPGKIDGWVMRSQHTL